LMVLFLVAILASFALMDINQFKSTGIGGGYLAKAGDQKVTEREFSSIAERALAVARQSNPEATMASIAGELPDIFNQLVDERALQAFGNAHGLLLSKRLVDGQIASLPNAKGLDGKFSEEAYLGFLRRERLTDAELRDALAADVRSRLLLTPVGSGALMPINVSTQYASMLMEQRSGELALVQTDGFTAGLSPSDGDLTAYYNANKGKYVVPEQRVLQLASIGPEQVAGVQPSDADIAAYYKANSANYATTPQRVISQATVANAQAANGIAQRAKAGGSFAAAAAPAGVASADTTLGVQTLAQYRLLAGDEAAKAVFAASKGGVVGPIKTQFGWTVAKVEDIRDQQGKSLAQAKPEIVAALVEAKRKDALAELVGKVEDMIADGSSLAEAAKANGLTLVETPPIMAQGVSRTNANYALPAQFKGALKSGFSLGSDEDPVVEGDAAGANYTLVGVGRIIPASPAPLAEIKDRVRTDWIQKQAMARARAVAQDIAAKVAKGMSVTDAAKASGQGKAQVQPITARRLQLSQVQPDAAVPLRMMFSLAQGKSRMAADPQGRGFFVIKTDKIVAGNAMTQPGLIAETQKAFSQTLGQELAQQFIAAVRSDVKVKRNEDDIKAAQARITGPTAAE